MPEYTPNLRLSETKERLHKTEEVRLDDTPRFSLESRPDKKIEPITISAKEQIRYAENSVFAEAVYNEILWLFEQTGKIDPEEFDRKATSIEVSLTTAQIAIFSRIRDRIRNDIENVAKIDQKTIEQIIQKAKELNYVPANVQPGIEITPWGAIVLNVDAKDWFPFDFKAKHTEAFKITETSQQGVNDPELQKFVERTIVIKRTDDEKRNTKVKRHEFFHDVYRSAIEPEQPILYDNQTEKKLFSQIKDEILAYLIEGKWESYLRNLSFDVRMKSGSDGKDAYGLFMDLWGLVVRNIQKEGNTPELAENEADNFTDMVWLLVREITRLYYSQALVEEGIKAVLTAQDAKEAMYKLRMIGDRSRIDGEALWQVLRNEQKEMKYGQDGVYAEHIEYFLDAFDYYQLPLVKNYDKFLSLLEEYIQSLKLQNGFSEEERIGNKNRIKNLETTLENLKKRK